MSIGLKRGTVVLEPHSEEWEVCAAETIAVLKEILGGDAVDIQHVGSTAIKGIAAKPIIDIAVGAENFENIRKHEKELHRAGIIFRGEDIEGQLLFVIGDFNKDTRSHHIHVVKWNGEEWLNYINFRDYLNADRDTAEAYSRLKKKLMKEYPDNRLLYTEGKKKMIAGLLEQAAQWREKSERQEDQKVKR